MKARTLRLSVLVTMLVVASTAPVSAQTVPPGAAAPVPLLPRSNTPPPATDIPPSLADIPIIAVSFSYFGTYAVVDELLVPVLVTAVGTVHCWSAPNATADEQVGAVDFGEKPSGSQFIAFFARGTRLYVFDTSGGNYCWIDNNVARS